MDQEVAKIYGNRVRVRACGLCWQNEKLLMVNHSGLTNLDFWAPPGGGVEFGKSIHASLTKEFEEETGLMVAPLKFAFACEYIQHPLHSVELFFHVKLKGGNLKTGADPELQIIRDVKFLSFAELLSLPPDSVHGIIKRAQSPAELRDLTGFFPI